MMEQYYGTYYGIIGIILRDYITESYYGVVLRNHPYEKDPSDTWGVPGPPWDPGDPLGTPLGSPGTPLGPPGTPQGHPGDVPDRNSQGPPMDHKNSHISTKVQRQKLSIAVFEPAH